MLTACIPVSSVVSIPTIAPASTTQEKQSPTAVRETQVQSVVIQFMQTDPVQVNAIVRGNLTESCAKFGDTQTSYASNTFHIKLLKVSPTDRGCAQVITPYEQTIPLNTTGLTPGTYTVVANGVSTTFNIPTETEQTLISLQLVVRASDGNLQVANLDIPLNPTARPAFNDFLPSGGASGRKCFRVSS